MDYRKIAVVIPVYKNNLSKYEAISLQQIQRILVNYDTYSVMPRGIQVEYIPPEFHKIEFDPNYFSSIHGYNRLMTSMEFYTQFIKYEYILVAQLDTFVFRDELVQWAKKGFDYVGAPWMFNIVETHRYLIPHLPLVYRTHWLKLLQRIMKKEYLVGNGGFSLRKVDFFTRIVKDFSHKVEEFFLEADRLRTEGVLTAGNEDAFWCLYLPSRVKRIRVPNYLEALKFSFETNPALCFELNQNQLPFGCHAWEKHGLDFWKEHIAQFGYEI